MKSGGTCGCYHRLLGGNFIQNVLHHVLESDSKCRVTVLSSLISVANLMIFSVPCHYDVGKLALQPLITRGIPRLALRV